MAVNKTTLQQILDTVQELHNLEQIVTREAVREATGLALTTVDDRLATLVDRGDITRIGRGVFVPAVRHPPARPISKTVLPDGSVKLEIGDDVLTLTPREDRILAKLQAGVAVELAAIDSGKEIAVLVASMRGGWSDQAGQVGRGSFRASQHTGTESPEFRQFSGVLGLLFMGYSNGIDA